LAIVASAASRRTDDLHHLSRADGVDGVPGRAVNLEAGAHDDPIGDREGLLRGFMSYARVSQDGNISGAVLCFPEVGQVDMGARLRAADQQGVRAEERGAAGAFTDRPAAAERLNSGVTLVKIATSSAPMACR
jgi:hypothetical protein